MRSSDGGRLPKNAGEFFFRRTGDRFSVLGVKVLGILVCLAVWGEEPSATFQDIEEVHRGGLHNCFRVSEKLYSGGQPEGEEGFSSLSKLGIKTVISVDGARPDVESARKYGLKYVHIPIGYDGIPRETMLRLGRAAEVLPGPIYVHCHHGKHRGPAAVAAIGLCTDNNCRAEDAVSFMKRAKTDPKYRGLYGAARTFRPPTREELKRVPIDFPETATVGDLAEAMTRIDREFEVLLPLTLDQEIKDPTIATQASVLLNESLREIGRSPETAGRSELFRKELESSLQLSEQLYQLMQSGAGLEMQREVAKGLKQSCVRCHERERDNP